jgi:capsular exopolysaccharide synthesis family protein
MAEKQKLRRRGLTSNLLTSKTAFSVVEAYKTIRTNLLFVTSTSQNKAVVFTSAEPSVGKSTTCINLAITMAQLGAHVVVIEADMRKPSLHRYVRVSNAIGLSKCLCGLERLEDSIYLDVFPNLDLITGGPIPPNPSELLNSERMVRLLDTLSETYDYIFVDTPPINVVADGLICMNHAAGAILIARQKQTRYTELQKAIDSIQNIHGNLLGVVVMNVNEKDKPYAYSQEYKYNYESKEK